MKVCIDCQKEVSGKRAVRVKEDRVIRLLRWIKRVLKVSKENELYVCEEDLSKHIERRKSFEKAMLFLTVLVGIIVFLLLITIIISGRIEVWTVLSAIMIGVLLFLFSLLFKYVPALEGAEPVAIPAEKKPEEAPKKAKKPRQKKKRGR